MKTAEVHVRVVPDLKQSLQKAADLDRRSFSSLVIKILEEWVEDNDAGVTREYTGKPVKVRGEWEPREDAEPAFLEEHAEITQEQWDSVVRPPEPPEDR